MRTRVSEYRETCRSSELIGENPSEFAIPTMRFARKFSTWNPPSHAEGAYPQFGRFAEQSPLTLWSPASQSSRSICRVYQRRIGHGRVATLCNFQTHSSSHSSSTSLLCLTPPEFYFDATSCGGGSRGCPVCIFIASVWIEKTNCRVGNELT